MISSRTLRYNCTPLQRNSRTIVRVLACVLWASFAAAQLSPGPLSKSHAFLSGATHCTDCHRLGSSQASYKCLDCHTEIAARIAAGRGLHSTMVQKASGSQTCRTCHAEHYGVDVALIKWQPPQSQFDHSKTGWPLVGHHLQQTCNKCHTPEHISSEERSAIKLKTISRSFLGLRTTCTNCHKDHHQGKFGQDCAKCHSPIDWKGVKGFDHSKTGYPLTGEHTKLECVKCHTPGPDNKPRFVELKHDGCDDCHKSPHGNAFPNKTCASCHSTSGFKLALVAIRGQFDHSTKRFALLGKHATVDCEKCHQGGSFTKPLVFAHCSNCHTPSPHGQQFVNRADGGECAACHNENGFKPTKFTVTNHTETKFPLDGKHATVECQKCHIPAEVITVTSNPTVYRLKFAQCNDCHKDQHRGQFKDPPHLNRCQICHNVTGFKPTKYTVEQHKSSDYPLLGAHIKVSCDACHRLKDKKTPEEALQFRFKDMTCTGCHQDPHKDEFHDQQVAINKDGKPAGCESCHTLESWQDVKRFNHLATKFVLVGPHRAAKCADCHKPLTIDGKLVNANFKVKSAEKCETCHADVHGAQFVSDNGPIDCASCHNVFRWKPSTFDHETQSTYKLEGEHRTVRCAECHKTMKPVNGKSVLFYRPTPTACSACHGSKQMKELAAD